MASDIAVSFFGAIQAAVSVLLTVWIGVLAAQYSLIDEGAAKQISRTCVSMFLPLLLISNLGKEMHADTVGRYVPIVAWSFIYVTLSILVGKLATRVFRLPAWTTPALAFNNSTSLPLLLIQSLEATGVLQRLTGADSDALDRARSYFLVCAVVNNTMTFGYGPKLLRPGQEDADSDPESSANASSQENSDDEGDNESQDGNATERTSLLPRNAIHYAYKSGRYVELAGSQIYNSLPVFMQKTVSFVSPFLNPPSIGALIGLTIGLIPTLHRLFFNDVQEGGYFKAWLTTPVKNTGELFVTLQVIIVGVKLSLSLRRMKEGEQSGHVPWGTVVFVLLWRFVVMPAFSIPIIWALARWTNVLASDPIIWFVMMLMPVGPPAMRLVALADVAHLPEEARMATAKLLTISYAATPLISIAVVCALRASQDVKEAVGF